MKAKTVLMLGAMLAGLGTLGFAASAAEISGAGATFPYPIYAKWAEAYKAKTGVSMNYQSIGSGGGIQQIKKKTVNFGGPSCKQGFECVSFDCDRTSAVCASAPAVVTEAQCLGSTSGL